MALTFRTVAPGKASRLLLGNVDAMPRHGIHGGYAPSAYPLLWVVEAHHRSAGGDIVGVAGYATAHLDSGVLHLRGCYIPTQYRGRGLQRRLLNLRLRYARRNGIRTVRTYVAVDNVPSLVNVIRAGFRPTRVSDGFLELEREP